MKRSLVLHRKSTEVVEFPVVKKQKSLGPTTGVTLFESEKLKLSDEVKKLSSLLSAVRVNVDKKKQALQRSSKDGTTEQVEGLSRKWIAVVQQTLLELKKRVGEMRNDSEGEATMGSLLSYFQIPAELVEYNVETDEFR